VLLVLAGRPGEVVSREELLSQVWKDVAVTDDAVTQTIAKLRHALGDTTKQPSYIQTIPKRGYRLVAPVRRPPVFARLPASAGHKLASHPRPWAIAGLILALAAGAVFAAMFRPEPRPAAVPAAAPAHSADLGAFPMIFVRPFNEVEADATQTVLARGLSARLVTDLSRHREIRVIDARAVPTSEAGKHGTPGSYLVSGEVQRSGQDIRVYVTLADAATGKSIWAEQYDRRYSDLFELQDELSKEVVARLKLKMADAEVRRRARPYTKNLEAYEHFLRAQSALIVRRKPQNEAARQLYEKAIALDPSFARAYAGLALTYTADRRNRWIGDEEGALTKAAALARTAQQIDPEIPETFFALAYVNMERGALAEALADLDAALRLNPSYADAYALLGAIRTYGGEPGETIPLIGTAMRLAPDAGHLYMLILGRAHFFLGNAQQAVLHLRQAVAANPENLESRLFLAAAYMQAGKREDAVWEIEEIRILEPAFDLRRWLKNYPMAGSKSLVRLTEALDPLGL